MRPWRWSVVLAGLLLEAGCARRVQPPAPPHAAPPLPRLDRAPPLRVVSHEYGGSAPVATATFTRALQKAGYELRQEPDRETVTVDVTTRTGRVLHDELAFVLFVKVLNGRTLGTEVQRTFVAEPSKLGEEQLRPLLAALAEDEALARYVRERDEAQRRTEAAERRRQAERDARREDAWREARVEECRTQATDSACRPLTEWLAQNGGDARAGGARDVLEATATGRAAHREVERWAGAQAELAQCRAPTRSADCDGLTAYALDFPAGAHADEARDVLARSKKRLDELASREERARVAKKLAGCRAFCTSANASEALFHTGCRDRPAADQGRCRRAACESTLHVRPRQVTVEGPRPGTRGRIADVARVPGLGLATTIRRCGSGCGSRGRGRSSRPPSCPRPASGAGGW